jgi:Zn-dependent membrane protease YugP|tara:strand:+ start:6452 stop:7117 length:666 start_codon:yes stop_codon:yes gene_type:complete
MLLFILVIAFTMIIGLWAQNRVQGAYGKWSKYSARSGITGREAAEYVMRSAGVEGVQITSTRGHLTDHYNPVTKNLVLSEENYHGHSLAALGVAAHEAGHAIQHAQGYSALKARMALVPVVGIANNLLMVMMFGGFFLGMTGLTILGVVAYGAITLFNLVTLPVEFDASKRAKLALVGTGILSPDERKGVDETLDAAGWTYVAAFVSSLAWLLYFLAASRD